jgi:hypothetical protein
MNIIHSGMQWLNLSEHKSPRWLAPSHTSRSIQTVMCIWGMALVHINMHGAIFRG